VISPASKTALGAPVSGSKIMTTPWCDILPNAKLPGKTLTSLAPKAPPSNAPGITPKALPSPRSIMLRSNWRVRPFDKAIIASRISGMHSA